MREINLLEKSHPLIQRKIVDGARKEENKVIAKRYDKEFFDGDRANGYGGYYYDGRWKKTVDKMIEVYGLTSCYSVLDIGCAKGFLLYDLKDMLPGIKVAGIDVSEYAVSNAMGGYGRYRMKLGASEKDAGQLEEIARQKVMPHIIVGNAKKLPWADKTFDVVLAINTIHNLPINECRQAIQEMKRVCRTENKMFIQVDAWRDETEKERMKKWALTAETMMSDKEWMNFYESCGYNGDCFWTTV